MSLRVLVGMVCALVVFGALQHEYQYSSSSDPRLRVDDEANIVLALKPASPAPTPPPSSLSPTSSSPTSAAPSSSSPTSAAPSSASPATAAPGFPLWLPPTPNTTVVGSYGDYEWVYPATLDRAEFAQKRFTAHELLACMPDKPCCAIGSRTGEEDSIITGRGLDFNYMMEFQPIPHRPLFSLVDTLKAWRRANPHRRGTKMKLLFIGDSITRQIFTGALCELARNEAVEWMTYANQPNAPLRNARGEHQVTFQEGHVKLKDEPAEEEYELLYIRQFRWTHNQKVMQRFLHGADVILFGLGLHYPLYRTSDSEFNAAIESITTALHATEDMTPPAARSRTLVWLGDPRQHFRYDQGDAQVTGRHDIDHRGPYRFCGPVARAPPDHVLSRSISTRAYDVLTTSPQLGVSPSWFRWNATWEERNPIRGSGGGLHLHFYPLYELTSPMFQNKVGFNADTLIRMEDCSHFSGMPNLYESLWDALYLIVDASAVTEGGEKSKPNLAVTRFPAGTQQHPNYVGFKGTTLDYQDILRDLAGQVL